MRSVANSLTLLRALMGVPVIIALSKNHLWIAWVIICCGCLTDIADGYFARKAGGGSSWGAMLDPLADKILLIAPLLWLNSKGIIPVWAVWILITRELLSSLIHSKHPEGRPASNSAKLKTSLQFISVLLLTWPISWGSQDLIYYLNYIGLILFFTAIMVAIYSLYRYLVSHQTVV